MGAKMDAAIGELAEPAIINHNNMTMIKEGSMKF